MHGMLDPQVGFGGAASGGEEKRNDPEGSRGGPTGRPTAGARMSAGTQRPTLMNDVPTDDDDENWYSAQT